MATVKLVKPSAIDINDLKDFIHIQKNKISLNYFDYNLLSIENNQEWLDLINQPKLQLKKYFNIFHFLICKTIEDDKLVGIVLIKKNINLEIDIIDSQIKYFFDESLNSGYELQIIHNSINYAKKENFDQLSLVTKGSNIELNKLLINLGALVVKKITHDDGNTYYRFNLSLI